ncbi:MAG: ABC transporter permease [Planctomycetaceae bacterium]|jgi:putative ABC transport system permease protein|nr:ABC transporter permease [Planctomycetaceae bacterium]
MKLLLKLIIREAWYHRARISFAVVATMAMCCMVVWLIGSIDLMLLRFDDDNENYLGNFQVAILPEHAPPIFPPLPSSSPSSLPSSFSASGESVFSAALLKELRSNEHVKYISPARQIRNVMAKMLDDNDDQAALRRQRAGTGTPMQSPPVIGIDVNMSPFELQDGRWFVDDSHSVEAAFEGVIGSGAAGSLRAFGEESEPVKVGDTVICRVDTHDFKIKIVGLFEQKLSGGRFGGGNTPVTGALYVSPKTAAKISPLPKNETNKIDFVYIRLNDKVNVKQFAETYKTKLAEDGIAMRFIDIEEVQRQLKTNRGFSGGGLMGDAGSTNSVIIFSTLVSILIVFTALSMGVSERSRVFAMLRSVGMQRWKISILVFGESVVLCFLGWLGGMLAGWIILQFTVWLQPDAFGGGKTIHLSATAIIVAGIAALTGSLLAAIYPAWRSSRIDPLDGMNRGYTATIETKWFALTAIAGALLLLICPIFTTVDSIAKGTELRVFLYTFIGLPTQILGCALITPAIILLVEKIFTPLVAKIMFVRKELLTKQLSINIWRTLGTTIAISIGLGVYSFLEISGYSMLVPFTHSKTLPNTLVTTNPTALPLAEIETVRNMHGINPKRFLPVALEQSFFSQRQATEFMKNGLNPQQTNAIVFGIDIKKAFHKQPDGTRPLIEVEFQDGTLQSALEKLETGGRYCLIPDSFAFRAGLKVGDKIELVVPRDFNNPNLTNNNIPNKIINPKNQSDKNQNLTSQNSTTQLDKTTSTPPQRPENLDNLNRPPNNRQGRGGRGFGGGGFGGGGFGGEEIVEYEVCGVVTIPGWLWMTKLSGVRKRGGRTGAMLLSPYEIVKKDFKLNHAGFFWFDRILDASGKPVVSDKELEYSLQKLADKYPVRITTPIAQTPHTISPENLSNKLPANSPKPNNNKNANNKNANNKNVAIDGGEMLGNEVIRHSMVKVNSREYLTDRVNSRADSVIQAAAKMPLIILAISSIGLMGTVAASIRMRRFEFGVLRSLGVTRFGLVRLIMSEAILISFSAIVISVSFGIVSAWCFIGLMRYTSFFGGFVSPLTIPIYWLSIGFVATLALCFIAATGPAIFAGKTEISKLLRE